MKARTFGMSLEVSKLKMVPEQSLSFKLKASFSSKLKSWQPAPALARIPFLAEQLKAKNKLVFLVNQLTAW